MPLIVTSGYGSSGVGSAFIIVSVTPFADHIELLMSAVPTLSGVAATPAGWGLSSPFGAISTITSVSIVGTKVILNVTPQTNEQTYILAPPAIGFVDVLGNPFNGPFAPVYTAVGLGPTIVSIRVPDARTLLVNFNKPVNATDAVDVTKYSINPGLVILSAVVNGALEVDLTTAKQTAGTLYTIIVNGVRDLAGNPA